MGDELGLPRESVIARCDLTVARLALEQSARDDHGRHGEDTVELRGAAMLVRLLSQPPMPHHGARLARATLEWFLAANGRELVPDEQLLAVVCGDVSAPELRQVAELIRRSLHPDPRNAADDFFRDFFAGPPAVFVSAPVTDIVELEDVSFLQAAVEEVCEAVVEAVDADGRPWSLWAEAPVRTEHAWELLDRSAVDIDRANVHALRSRTDAHIIVGFRSGSFGSGAELALLPSGVPVLCLLPDDVRFEQLSPLLLGRGRVRPLEIERVAAGGRRALTQAFLLRWRSTIEANRRRRLARDPRFASLSMDLKLSLEGLTHAELRRVADGLGVRSERLFEVVSNVHHLATASLEDVLDLAAALDVSPRDLLFARPPRRIGTVEDAALQAYAEHIGIPLVEILRLRRAAEEHADDLALVVPADWAQLASRIGDAVQG